MKHEMSEEETGGPAPTKPPVKEPAHEANLT